MCETQMPEIHSPPDEYNYLAGYSGYHDTRAFIRDLRETAPEIPCAGMQYNTKKPGKTKVLIFYQDIG